MSRFDSSRVDDQIEHFMQRKLSQHPEVRQKSVDQLIDEFEGTDSGTFRV